MRRDLAKYAGAILAAGSLFAAIPSQAQQAQGSGDAGVNGRTYSENRDEGRDWGWIGLLGLAGLLGLRGRHHDTHYRRDVPGHA